MLVTESFDVAARELACAVSLKAERRVASDVLPMRKRGRHSLCGATFCFGVEWEADGAVGVGKGVDITEATDGRWERSGGVEGDFV